MEIKFKKYGRKKEKLSLQHGIMKHCIYEDSTGSMRLETFCPEGDIKQVLYLELSNK